MQSSGQTGEKRLEVTSKKILNKLRRLFCICATRTGANKSYPTYQRLPKLAQFPISTFGERSRSVQNSNRIIENSKDNSKIDIHYRAQAPVILSISNQMLLKNKMRNISEFRYGIAQYTYLNPETHTDFLGLLKTLDFHGLPRVEVLEVFFLVNQRKLLRSFIS